MTTLMQASRQWSSRPDDQRFTSLDELLAHTRRQRAISKSTAISTRALRAAPIEDDESRKSLVVLGPDGSPSVPTNWSFGQFAQRVGAPAGYLRTLPADIAADALNYGLFKKDAEDTGILLRQNGVLELAAMTGANYGRVWNSDVISALVDRFGNGIDGQFTVPGEFGKDVDVTKRNTTLYGSDRDVFVFLADEKNRIEVPNRRHGQKGSLARGFFVWNSEVGSATLGIGTFLFDFVCSNRMVWGAQGYEEIKLRHTSSAPYRWIEEVAPAIEAYAEKSTSSISAAIANAQAKRIDKDHLDDFLKVRFTKTQAAGIKLAHLAEEDRPIETIWDVTVGATAYAKGLKHQDARVEVEKTAGKIMAMAS